MTLDSVSFTATFEVVVVGGGVIGSSIALNLARRGLKVMLIDGSRPEHLAASQAAGAMLGAFGEVTALDQPPAVDVDLAARISAADAYGAWVESLGNYSPAPTLHRGTLILASATSRQDRNNITAIKAALSFHSRRYESVDVDGLPYINPASDRPIAEAVYLPDENSVNIPELLESLGAELQNHPRVTILREEVQRLSGPADRITGVMTAASAIHAKWVVLAAGIYTTRLLSTHSTASSFVPPLLEGKGTSVVVECEEVLPNVIRTPNREFSCGLHLVPRGRLGVYIGATNRVSSVPGATGRAAVGEVHYLLDSVIHEIDTRLTKANVMAVTAGSRPISPDRRPLLGITGLPGLAVATATYRNGVLLAPYAAELVADEIANESGSAGNSFTPIGRIEKIAATSVLNARGMLLNSAEDLLSMFIEPRGSLPYGRDQEFIRLFKILISLINDSMDPMVQELCHDTVDKFPINEIVPELLVVLLSRQAKEGGIGKAASSDL